MLVLGNKNKRLDDAKTQRRLQWLIYCSYADPKTMIKSEFEFMPLEGDVIPKNKTISINALKKAHEAFKNLKK